MTAIRVSPLRESLPFGACISGVTYPALEDPEIRRQILAVFESRGLIVFENVEPTTRMHLAISHVFGPLKEHPNPAVARVDKDSLPGVIDMHIKAGESGLVQLGGERLSSWIPWHFDHCYNNELNRAGVLRAVEIAPAGGMTGFADGIQLYAALSPSLRSHIEHRKILYKMDVIYANMRFGKPKDLIEVAEKPRSRAVNDAAKHSPRAVHPAVWSRQTGEKVLHVSPWMAQGIEGMEDEEGDALLEAVCQELTRKMIAYHHQWRLTDMLIWDNWRMLHSVTGMDPCYSRRMQRTTIKGDYGLGYFEHGGVGAAILEMTV